MPHIALHPGSRNRPTGFTLIEVLCCCCVIALLTGLLLPALAGAREAGRGAACSSNLRQLALAGDVYAGDNRANYAPGAPDFLANHTRWFGARASLSQPFDNEGGPLSDYLGATGGQAVRRCGSFHPATGGSAFERGCGGYGYNTAFVGVRGRWSGDQWTVETDRSGSPVAAFTNPSAVIAFADTAMFVGASAGLIEYSFAEPRRWPSDPAQRPDPSMHFRHRTGRSGAVAGEAGAAWLDGHVATVSRAFTWSSGIYGTPGHDPLLGWPGAADNNSLFGGRERGGAPKDQVRMVNRCICHEVPFWAIAELAKQGKTFEQIKEATNCCRGCGTCEPYVRVVIATGAVDLPVLSAAQQDAIMAEAWRRDAEAAKAQPPAAPDPLPPQ